MEQIKFFGFSSGFSSGWAEDTLYTSFKFKIQWTGRGSLKAAKLLKSLDFVISNINASVVGRFYFSDQCNPILAYISTDRFINNLPSI